MFMLWTRENSNTKTERRLDQSVTQLLTFKSQGNEGSATFLGTVPAEDTKIWGGQYSKTLIGMSVWSTSTVLNLGKSGGPLPPCLPWFRRPYRDIHTYLFCVHLLTCIICSKYICSLYNSNIDSLQSTYFLKSNIVCSMYITGPSEGTEKWGVKTQKWGGKNQILAKICLLLTNFDPFLAKVGGQLTPLPPCFRRPCYKFKIP